MTCRKGDKRSGGEVNKIQKKSFQCAIPPIRMGVGVGGAKKKKSLKNKLSQEYSINPVRETFYPWHTYSI